MDTITHGIAGALLGKAVFRGDNMFSRHPMSRARIITWALMLGAIFPDSDVLREFFSSNDLLIITWHRSITHSLVCLPFFTFSAILLVPQLLAWVYAHPEKLKRRALGIWLVFAPAPLVIAAIGRIVGAPISNRVVLSAIVLFSGLFLLPALRGWGLRIRHSSWNLAGFVGALVYFALTIFTHRAAFARVEKFASWNHLEVEA